MTSSMNLFICLSSIELFCAAAFLPEALSRQALFFVCQHLNLKNHSKSTYTS